MQGESSESCGRALAHARRLRPYTCIVREMHAHGPLMRTGRIDRVIEFHTSRVDLPSEVGKLGKITDKYSASKEWLALRLDLAILIVAPRARRHLYFFFSAAPRTAVRFGAFSFDILPRPFPERVPIPAHRPELMKSRGARASEF